MLVHILIFFESWESFTFVAFLFCPFHCFEVRMLIWPLFPHLEGFDSDFGTLAVLIVDILHHLVNLVRILVLCVV